MPVPRSIKIPLDAFLGCKPWNASECFKGGQDSEQRRQKSPFLHAVAPNFGLALSRKEAKPNTFRVVGSKLAFLSYHLTFLLLLRRAESAGWRLVDGEMHDSFDSFLRSE
jgi:hypothetical protein